MLRSHHLRSAATAAAARRSTRTSVRSARRSCRSAATATTSAFLGLPRKLNLDAADLEQRFRDAEPPVSSRLLLQRDAGRAARQPRAVVVSERCVSHAEAAGRARRVPARARRAARRGEPEEAPKQGAAGAARRSVRAERGARRDPRAARGGRAGRRVEGAARAGARSRSKRKRDEHERAARRSCRAQWDALVDARAGDRERRAVLDALRERVLERNYINNLLAGIERELARRPELGAADEHVKVVGIDLGTTNSLVAYVEGRRAGRHPRRERRRAGAVDRLGRRRRHDLRRPRGAAAAADRRRAHGLLGQALHGQGRRRRRRTRRSLLPFRVGGEAGGVVRIGLGDREFTPPEISAFILRELKRRAEEHSSPSRASSTPKSIARSSPCRRTSTTRSAPRRATPAGIAGLEVLRIINEPTAASLAYGLDKRKHGLDRRLRPRRRHVRHLDPARRGRRVPGAGDQRRHAPRRRRHRPAADASRVLGARSALARSRAGRDDLRRSARRSSRRSGTSPTRDETTPSCNGTARSRARSSRR